MLARLLWVAAALTVAALAVAARVAPHVAGGQHAPSAALAGVHARPASAAAGTDPLYTVNSAGSQSDDQTNFNNRVCNVNPPTLPGPAVCTFEAALELENVATGPTTINFAIPVTGVVILDHSAEPTKPGTLIDGTTQADTSGLPLIDVRGLLLEGPNQTVRGVLIPFGMFMEGGGDRVTRSFIGTNPAGTAAAGNTADGVRISSSGNIVDGNLISGNRTGVVVTNSGNVVRGNRIGTDVSGTLAVPNTDGVEVFNSASSANNLIGGSTLPTTGNCTGDCNVIAGNSIDGVHVAFSGTSTTVRGNLIGLNIAGSALPNNVGVDLSDGATNVTVGGTCAHACNVISGNTTHGVFFNSEVCECVNADTVTGNYIGTSLAGTAARPNGIDGVLVAGAENDQIGGTAAGSGNVISGNGHDGVELAGKDGPGAFQVTIGGNRIGTDVAGGAALPNGANGVEVVHGSSNVIGGSTAHAGNLISGNFGDGVLIGGGFSANSVLGNFIGLAEPTGTSPSSLANGGNGVEVSFTPGTTIGGTTSGTRNLIAGNAMDGVLISGDSTDGGTTVLGNYIGMATGNAALANGLNGVEIVGVPFTSLGGTSGTTAGGPCTGACNLISSNGAAGVLIRRGSASSNQVQGNYIGTDGGGLVAFGNKGDGVVVSGATNNTVGGTATGAGNVISGNASSGVLITGTSASGNQLLGNSVGIAVNGTAGLPNDVNGVLVDGAPNNVIGGTARGARNVIAANRADGVKITGAASSGNQVLGDYIGTDASGAAPPHDAAGAAVSNFDGVELDGSSSNVIGGSTAGDGNVIAGNALDGVRLSGAGTSANQVQGNVIGLAVGGTVALANGSHGVEINGAPSNDVGGALPAAGNTLSGNGTDGVWIAGAGAIGNTLQSNRIGTDVTGTLAVANGRGVTIGGGSGTTVGGADRTAGNLISGNLREGVLIFAGANATVEGNIIGANAAGTAALPNRTGVSVNAPGNTIGATSRSGGNLISGNTGDGLLIGAAGTGTVVQGNTIGTQAAGTIALPNANGVDLVGASGATIGGATFDAGNLVSGNARDGILLAAGAANNKVQFNDVGADFFETTGLGNGRNGVEVQASPNNTIGDTRGALIAGNLGDGVLISGAAAKGNVVQFSFIGTDINGTGFLKNTRHGVEINGAPGNTVSADLVSGNGLDGVLISGAGASGNTVASDTIGSNLAATGPLANGNAGVEISGAPTNTVGTGFSGNLISGNLSDGVLIVNGGATGNVVQANLIGTQGDGASPLGNGGNGVDVNAAPGNTIGGIGAGDANVIAHNGGAGVAVVGNAAVHDAIRTNAIFMNARLGIDLGADGVTLNHVGAAVGPNTLQNYPLLTSAVPTTNGTTVRGTLNSLAGTTFALEFFSSPACDPSGHGQGKTFLGTSVVTTDGGGSIGFSVSLPVSTAPGSVITATATDPNGNTSEFSACAVVQVNPSVVLAHRSGIQGSANTATARLYLPGETVKLFWASATGAFLGSAVANAQGTAAIPYTTPVAPHATYRVFAVGQTSHASAFATFTLVPSLSIAPRHGPQGSAAVVTATGFGTGDSVTILWNCAAATCGSTTVLASTTADANGNVAGLTVTIPATATAGTYAVGGRGSPSAAFAATTFTVTPTLSVSPTSGSVGSMALVRGTGYGAAETVTVAWRCSAASCATPTVLATPISDANGDFSVSVTIPAATGTVSIRGRGGSTQATAFTVFTVT